MSGVYIPGMEMPTNCCECFAFKSNADGYLFCKAKRLAFGKEDAEWLPLKTPNWCPLVPVPPHGRLIDADAFTKDECNYCDGACEALPCDCLNCEADCRCDFMQDIANAPTIIPAEEGEG